MTAQQTDQNGFIEIKDNPITKEGVYKYLGSEIGADDPEKIYYVYRPAEELEKEECINSFKLIPFIDQHAFLGSEEMGATPPEEKGVHGVIGEQVRFENPYILGNLKIYSESMKNAIDPKNPKREIDLSAGYACSYEFTPGVFNGEKYDAIQRDIRGNHLAKVPEGRTGKDVRVLDQQPKQFLKFTCDTAENISMADENEKEAIKARLTDALDKLKDMDASERDELLKPYGIKFVASNEEKATDKEETKVEDEEEVIPPAKDEEKAKTEDKEEVKAEDEDAAKAMDAANKRIKELELQLKTRPTQDAMFQSIADRDRLAEKVKPFIGTFDHAAMTKEQVAAYAAKKVGLNVKEGTAVIALDAWMHGRVPDSEQKTKQAMDSTPNAAADSLFNQYNEAQ